LLVFGGGAFNQHPDAAEELGGVYLADNVVDAATRLDDLVSEYAEQSS
jgi:hypothetical protein